MNRTLSFAVGIVLVAGLGIAAVAAYGQHGSHEPGYGMGRGMGHGPGMRRHGPGMGRHGSGHAGNPIRHRIVRHGGGVPVPYTDMQNPLKVSKANIDVGAKLYAEHCATCHGKSGDGDGQGGKELNPKPANLAFVMDRWIATDGFLMWSISEGGQKLKTEMPSFKDVLTEKERWQIIHYLDEGL